MKNQCVKAALLLIIFSFVPASAGTVMELVWEDLVPVMEFDDPFEKLKQEQLHHLGRIARVRQLQEMGKDSGEASMKELEEAADALTKEGIDYEYLLAKRDEIRELRRKASEEVVEDLDNKMVTLGGFLLPLEFSGKEVTEFLLVPWVGACIHTPPPPPNQIIHVKINENGYWKSKGRFEPVKVTGKIVTKITKKNLFLIDGSSDINIGYFIQASTVEKYKTNS